ncbi:hypothetical protein GFH30_12840 [Acinetobacter wanghuae]|uniref:O-antigen ligase domain-containing protein n=1 Tax=Acinetobacter wanghuae TaxID=2662362 RepID=A0A5Q0P4Y3_9GAMM|nr:hypothetical protein [Acinetobacter wanghuae]MQW92631.1 hypothetical protein [Acinetobacter wanghuae]QGA12189.1 hypothetical protein GFH30_12840 [Acinetobacter wanghuae]
MYVLKRDNFLATLFFVVIFFIVFDGVRNNLIFSPYLSLIREISLLLILILGFIFRRRIDKKYLSKFIPLILFSFFILCLWPITIFLNFSDFYFVEQEFGNKFSIYYKHFIFPFCFLATYALLKGNDLLQKKIVNIFVVLSSLYGYVTLPLYFFPLPFFNEVYKDYGRFGVGYPTMDGQVFILSLFCLIFLAKKKIIMFHFCLYGILLGMLSQNTGTMYVSLLLMIIFGTFLNFKRTLYIVLNLSILLITSVFIIIQNYYDLYIDMSKVFLSKLYTFIDSNNVAIDTVSMRESQYELLNSYIKTDDMYYIFGVGASSYVENQFLYIKTAFGNLGFLLYLISLTYIFIITLFIENKNKLKIIFLYIIFSLSSYTLLTIYFFPTVMGFSLLINILYLNGKMKPN